MSGRDDVKFFNERVRVHSRARLDLVNAELQRARRRARPHEAGLLEQIPNYWLLSTEERLEAIARR